MRDLETILGGEEARFVRDGLVRKIEGRQNHRAANSYNPYFKYQLEDAVQAKIESYASVRPNIKNKLKSINKPELKRVYYGLVCLGGADESSKKVIEHLGDWEKIAFFAGIWANHGNNDLYGKELNELVGDYVKKGYDYIHKSHMIKKARGRYKRKLKLPGSQDYTKQKKLDLIGDSFGKLLDAETQGGEDAQERTAVFLDRCDDVQLRYLTKRYGAEKLGWFATYDS